MNRRSQQMWLEAYLRALENNSLDKFYAYKDKKEKAKQRHKEAMKHVIHKVVSCSLREEIMRYGRWGFGNEVVFVPEILNEHKQLGDCILSVDRDRVCNQYECIDREDGVIVRGDPVIIRRKDVVRFRKFWTRRK